MVDTSRGEPTITLSRAVRQKGSIQVGKDADLVVLEDNYDVLQTYCMGQPKL